MTATSDIRTGVQELYQTVSGWETKLPSSIDGTVKIVAQMLQDQSYTTIHTKLQIFSNQLSRFQDALKLTTPNDSLSTLKSTITDIWNAVKSSTKKDSTIVAEQESEEKIVNAKDDKAKATSSSLDASSYETQFQTLYDAGKFDLLPSLLEEMPAGKARNGLLCKFADYTISAGGCLQSQALMQGVTDPSLRKQYLLKLHQAMKGEVGVQFQNFYILLRQMGKSFRAFFQEYQNLKERNALIQSVGDSYTKIAEKIQMLIASSKETTETDKKQDESTYTKDLQAGKLALAQVRAVFISNKQLQIQALQEIKEADFIKLFKEANTRKELHALPLLLINIPPGSERDQYLMQFGVVANTQLCALIGQCMCTYFFDHELRDQLSPLFVQIISTKPEEILTNSLKVLEKMGEEYSACILLLSKSEAEHSGLSNVATALHEEARQLQLLQTKV